MGNRKAVPYTLRSGNRIVYVGTTNDPAAREQQHRDEGKQFGSLRPEGPRRTEQSARNWKKNVWKRIGTITMDEIPNITKTQIDDPPTCVA